MHGALTWTMNADSIATDTSTDLVEVIQTLKDLIASVDNRRP